MRKQLSWVLILLVGCGTQLPSAGSSNLVCHVDTDCLRAERCVYDGSEQRGELPAGRCGIPEQHICTSDADCGEGQYCQPNPIVGADAGIDLHEATARTSLAAGLCVVRPQTRTCESNSDCQSGERCELTVFATANARPAAQDAGEPAEDAGHPTADAGSPAVGICVPSPRVDECDSDEQCGRGFHCEFSRYDGGSAPAPVICVFTDAGPSPEYDGGISDAGPSPEHDGGIRDAGPAPDETDARPVPEYDGGISAHGVCVMDAPPPPPPTVCHDDSECHADQICDFSIPSTSDHRQAFVRAGICVPAPIIEPTACRDTRDCYPGETCEHRFEDPDDAPSQPNELGLCVPTRCSGDHSCPPNSICQVNCLPCAADSSCAACEALCVPPTERSGAI